MNIKFSFIDSLAESKIKNGVLIVSLRPKSPPPAPIPIKRKKYKYYLGMTKSEAGLLKLYISSCLKFGAELDPEYKDMQWKKQKTILESLIKDLPNG